jgi:hypothetical protein
MMLSKKNEGRVAEYDIVFIPSLMTIDELLERIFEKTHTHTYGHVILYLSAIVKP